MKFLIDANLPPALAAWLQRDGYDAVHVLEAPLPDVLDGTIWNAARSNDQIIITKDSDFLHFALADPGGPRVVIVQCGNLTLRKFRAWLGERKPGLMAELAAGERIVELA